MKKLPALLFLLFFFMSIAHSATYRYELTTSSHRDCHDAFTQLIEKVQNAKNSFARNGQKDSEGNPLKIAGVEYYGVPSHPCTNKAEMNEFAENRWIAKGAIIYTDK